MRAEMESVTRFQILERNVCISLHANTLVGDVNLFLLLLISHYWLGLEYAELVEWVECPPMVKETSVLSQVALYPSL